MKQSIKINFSVSDVKKENFVDNTLNSYFENAKTLKICKDAHLSKNQVLIKIDEDNNVVIYSKYVIEEQTINLKSRAFLSLGCLVGIHPYKNGVCSACGRRA